MTTVNDNATITDGTTTVEILSVVDLKHDVTNESFKSIAFPTQGSDQPTSKIVDLRRITNVITLTGNIVTTKSHDILSSYPDDTSSASLNNDRGLKWAQLFNFMTNSTILTLKYAPNEFGSGIISMNHKQFVSGTGYTWKGRITRLNKIQRGYNEYAYAITLTFTIGDYT